MILALLLACGSPGPAPRPVGPIADASMRLAVIVGYDPSDRASDTAEEGARQLASALEQAGWRVSLLTGRKASSENLRETLGSLATSPGHTPSSEDRLLLYVAAHGERQRDAAGALAPTLRLSEGSARVSALVNQLDGLPVLRKALVLDSCFPAVSDNATPGQIDARSTLVLTAAGSDQPSNAIIGDGGIYTDCLLQALGTGSLLRAHHQASACVRRQREAQQPRVYPPQSPVFDLPIAEETPSFGALLDGLTPSLPAGWSLSWDGEDLRDSGGLLLLSAQQEHTLALSHGGQPVASLTRSWPSDTLIGLPAAPDTVPGPDWLRMLPEARPRDPVLRDIAHSSGLSSLVAGGKPKGAVAVSLDGLRSGWFVVRAGTTPVYAVNLAKPGEDPSYGIELDLSRAPRPHAVSDAPVVLDLDQDGLPEACYLAENRRLYCVNQQGVANTAVLPDVAVVTCDSQADLDRDGDLDLLMRTPEGWQVWTWRSEARRYEVEETLPFDYSASRAATLDLDGDHRRDLLLSQRGAEVRFYGADGRPWATALEGRSLGLEDEIGVPRLVGDHGRWQLIATNERHGCSTFYAVGHLHLGPAEPGPITTDEGPCISVSPGDLDLDGLLDLVNVHRDTWQSPHRVFLRRPTLGGWRQLIGVPGLDISTDDQDVYLDDVDDDGDLDLLALNGEELPDLPPDGCCRLYVSDASAHAAHLAVDLAPAGGPAVDAEIRVDGVVSSPMRVTGARLRGAGLFGLGAGGVPGAVSVRWPDGSTETVTDPARFKKEDGGFRVELQRSAEVQGRLLVGGWIVDLGASPSLRVQRAPGLPDGMDPLAAWHTPIGTLVWTNAPNRLRLIDSSGVATGASARASGCAWGGYVGGALSAVILGCGASEHGVYREPLYTWRPDVGFRPGPKDGPAYIRTVAWSGDRVWIASRRRLVEEFEVGPALKRTGRSLPAPEGAVERNFLQLTPGGDLLVLDQYAGRVEVWSGSPPTLQRLIPVGTGIAAPAWDPRRGVWLIPMDGGVVAVDPRFDQPVARWVLPSQAYHVLPLHSGDLVVLLRAGRPELQVLGEPGDAPRLVVPLPKVSGDILMLLP